MTPLGLLGDGGALEATFSGLVGELGITLGEGGALGDGGESFLGDIGDTARLGEGTTATGVGGAVDLVTTTGGGGGNGWATVSDVEGDLATGGGT